MNKKKSYVTLFSLLMTGLTVVVFGYVLYCTFTAVRTLGAAYQQIASADLNNGLKAVLNYDDGMNASLGFGAEILATDANKEILRQGFLSESLLKIDRFLLSSGLVYLMMVHALLAFPLYLRFSDSRKEHVLSVILSAFVLFGIYVGVVSVGHSISRMPFDLSSVLSSLLGVCCIAAGGCAVGLLLAVLPVKFIPAIVAVPLVYALFLFGSVTEAKLYSPKTVDSFDYVYQLHPEILQEGYSGEAYYDEEKNVMVINGEEFAPQLAENPEHFKGIGKVGGIAYEVIDPYSGMSLALMESSTEMSVPALAKILYLLKAFFWMALCAALPKEE